MAEASTANASGVSERNLAVALIALARYLADKDPKLTAYLKVSLDHARALSLSEEDLATLKLVLGAIGGSLQPMEDRVSRA